MANKQIYYDGEVREMTNREQAGWNEEKAENEALPSIEKRVAALEARFTVLEGGK